MPTNKMVGESSDGRAYEDDNIHGRKRQEMRDWCRAPNESGNYK